LAPVQQFAQQHGVEIFVGEFGAPRWAPNAARLRYLRDLLLIFDTWGWSWTYHGWREWHGWDAEMGADETRHERRANEPAYQLLRDALNACAVPASR
jgi:endoglucanase